MGLALLNELDPVLDGPQENVRISEPFRVSLCKEPVLHETPEAPEGVSAADGRGFPTVYKLKGLDQELDLPDSTPSQLDISHPTELLPDMAVDAILQKPYLPKCVVIQQASVYEG